MHKASRVTIKRAPLALAPLPFYGGQRTTAVQFLALAMPNAGSHTSLPASEFTTTFAGFLDAHSDATPSERCSSSDARRRTTALLQSTRWRIGEAIRPENENQPEAMRLLASSSNWGGKKPPSGSSLVFYASLAPPSIRVLMVWHGVCIPLISSHTDATTVRHALDGGELVDPDWGRNGATGDSS